MRDDGLRSARGCFWGVVLSALFWALIITCAVLIMNGCSAGRTVPSEVLADRIPVDVAAVAADEIAGIEAQGFDLPPYTLALLDRYGTNGNTVITHDPLRYTIVLWSNYWTEAQARKTAAHEVAHILFDINGLPQDEGKADLFAACYGSPQARQYARQYGHPDGKCSDLSIPRR